MKTRVLALPPKGVKAIIGLAEQTLVDIRISPPGEHLRTVTIYYEERDELYVDWLEYRATEDVSDD